MKASYYIEITLLILLSVSAATLAADHNFFELIGLGKGFEDIVAIIRIIAFSSVIFFSVANVYKHIHSQRKIVSVLLNSIHNVFFKGINLEETSSNRIYRVTCYKYYKFGYRLFLLFITTFILSIIFSYSYIIKSTNTIPAILLCVVVLPIICILFYILLYIFDNWWFQSIRRVFSSGRRLKIRRDYLLSYERYGYENGKLNKNNTTIPVLIDQMTDRVRMFAGIVYCSSQEYEKSINNHDINVVLNRLKNKMIEEKKYKEHIAGFFALLNDSIDENINALNDKTYFQTELNPTEKNQVAKFMKETCTYAYDLFNINNILHSNHFVGFKIKGKNNVPWGVVVLDVLSNDNKDFFKYLNIDPEGPDTQENNEQWLNLVLKSYSEIFSNTINPQIHE